MMYSGFLYRSLLVSLKAGRQLTDMSTWWTVHTTVCIIEKELQHLFVFYLRIVCVNLVYAGFN